ncbi:RAB-33 protein [Aphelenchoides fujianensis]|nr:RAB-33 protein [Aphelenchoides fujianensis]
MQAAPNSAQPAGQTAINVEETAARPPSAANTLLNQTFTSTPQSQPSASSSTVPTKPSIIPHASPRGHYTTKRVFKVIIIGDAFVGKTCLSFRFCNNRFPAQTEATIGVDFRERTLAIENELIRVQLWDTAGQERYRQSIVAHYYRNVNAVSSRDLSSFSISFVFRLVFVYDVNNPASFRSLVNWINECKKHGVSSNEVPHLLIGNKCDLESPQRVPTGEAQVFADQNDMALFETSALADSEADHVEAIFMTLLHALRQSKSMHVQTEKERSEKDQTLLLEGRRREDVGGAVRRMVLLIHARLLFAAVTFRIHLIVNGQSQLNTIERWLYAFISSFV